MATLDQSGRAVQCSSCSAGADGEGLDGMQRMYQTAGPVQTTETDATENGHRSTTVQKQLYLCERCFDMNLFPPLTHRGMFREELENRAFVQLLREHLMDQYKGLAAVSSARLVLSPPSPLVTGVLSVPVQPKQAAHTTMSRCPFSCTPTRTHPHALCRRTCTHALSSRWATLGARSRRR